MSDMATSHAPHRFTVEEYQRMGESGVFSPDAHLELIEGTLIERMAPMKPPHASAIMKADRLWASALRELAIVRAQLPITLGDFSEPEPDLAIVRGPIDRYEARHPGPDDIYAVVEISEMSRMFDLNRKVPVYAKHRIVEVWLVDLIDACIRTFRDSDGTAYRERDVVPLGGSIAFSAFPRVRFAVDDLVQRRAP